MGLGMGILRSQLKKAWRDDESQQLEKKGNE